MRNASGQVIRNDKVIERKKVRKGNGLLRKAAPPLATALWTVLYRSRDQGDGTLPKTYQCHAGNRTKAVVKFRSDAIRAACFIVDVRLGR